MKILQQKTDLGGGAHEDHVLPLARVLAARTN